MEENEPFIKYMRIIIIKSLAMKTNLYFFSIVFSSLLLISSCKSVKIVEHNPNIQGKWNAIQADTSYYIEIDAKSNIFYQMVTGVSSDKSTGVAKYRNNKMCIGIVSFKISKEPTIESPNEFILSGITYTKTE